MAAKRFAGARFARAWARADSSSPRSSHLAVRIAALLPKPDAEGLLEYSVVYTDRALNHMSARFRGVMTDISRVLKTTYAGHTSIVVPGGGTFGMEAVAR
jgi:hypothetical protein